MSEPAQKCNYIDIFKQNYVLKLFIALKWPFFKKSQPRSLFCSFWSFKTSNTIFTTNQCEKMSKCPSSIWRRDLNPRLYKHELSPIPPLNGLFLLLQFMEKYRFSRFPQTQVFLTQVL